MGAAHIFGIYAEDINDNDSSPRTLQTRNIYWTRGSGSSWSQQTISSYPQVDVRAVPTSWYAIDRVKAGVNGSGQALVAWNYRNESYNGFGLIGYRRFNGTSWGSQATLSDCYADRQCRLYAAGMFPDGRGLILYRQYPSRELRYQALDASGNLGSTGTLYGGDLDRAELAVDELGQAHTYFVIHNGTDWVGRYSRYTGGSWSTPEAVGLAGLHPAYGIAADSTGRPVVTIWRNGDTPAMFERVSGTWQAITGPTTDGSERVCDNTGSFVFSDTDQLLIPEQANGGSYGCRQFLRAQQPGGWANKLAYLDQASFYPRLCFHRTGKRLHYAYWLNGGTVRYGTADWGIDREPPGVAFTGLAKSSFAFGEAVDVTWSATDNVGVASQQLLWVESNGTEHTITTLGGGARAYQWTTPDAGYLGATLKLKVSDATNNVSSATSTVFDIKEPTPPSISVLSPVASELLVAGAIVEVRYSASDDVAIDHIEVEFRETNAESYQSIAPKLANTGSYQWSIPNISTSDGTLKVIAVDTSGNKTEATIAGLRVVFDTAENLVLHDLKPADGQGIVPRGTSLNWSVYNTTDDVAAFDVYLSTTKSEVDGLTAGARITSGSTSTTVSPGSLTYATTYYWRVEAIAGGNTASSATRTMTIEAQALAAPTNLAATVTKGPLVTLSWIDNASDETGYRVLRSVDGNSYSSIADVGANAATYADSSIEANTRYLYKVVAIGATGQSLDSNVIAVSTLNNPPNAPTLIVPPGGATNVAANAVTLVWSGSDPDLGDPLSYRLYLGTSTSPGLVVSNTVGTSYAPSGLVENRVYYWRVVAIDGLGAETSSELRYFTTSAITQPAGPTGLVATAEGSAAALLSWTNTASNELGLLIERKMGTNGAWGQIASLPAGSNSYRDSFLLVAGTTYSYRVFAYSAAGLSVSSNESSVLLPNTAPTIDPAVPDITVALGESKVVQLAYYKNDESDRADSLIWSISGVDTTLSTVTLSGDSLTVVPTGSKMGTDAVVLTLTDSGGMTAQQALHITITGKGIGVECTNGSECSSGNCIDAVCCDTTCGSGSSTDCQACSIAAGAQQDGVCGPVGQGTVCRGAMDVCDAPEVCDGVSTACPADAFAQSSKVCRSARGECDVAETCSGMAQSCPADQIARDGTSCPGGACLAGQCIPTTPNDAGVDGDAGAVDGDAASVDDGRTPVDDGGIDGDAADTGSSDGGEAGLEVGAPPEADLYVTTDAAVQTDASPSTTDTAGAGGSSSGGGCSMGGQPTSSSLPAVLVLGALFVTMLRRRRRD